MSPARPFFSVVIPTYNRRELLAMTLESVWTQRWHDHEVLVVDDGSTDGTWDDLEKIRHRVRVLRQANQGPGSARNLALGQATGKYVAFLDSDDLWFPWTLELYARVIDARSQPSFVTGCAVTFTRPAELSTVREAPPQDRAFTDYFASGDAWRWYGLSSFVVKRELIQEAGGFAPASINGEDADLALRLGAAPGFVQVESPATYAYREHAGGVRHELRKTLQGQLHQLAQEEQGRYPGGAARARERWRLMSPHMRSCSIACAHAGMKAGAWTLYRRTFRWHLSLGRWKYLAAFPLVVLTSRIKKNVPSSS